MTSMTVEQAIKIIEEATAQLRLTRKEHELVLAAIQVLSKARDTN